MKDSKQTEKCSATVHSGGWGMNSYRCSKNWKVRRDGKRYCTIHDPVRVEERRRTREAKWRKEFSQDNRKLIRTDLERIFCKGTTNTFLRRNKLVELIREHNL